MLHCNLLNLDSNDMNSLKTLFLKKVRAINILVIKKSRQRLCVITN